MHANNAHTDSTENSNETHQKRITTKRRRYRINEEPINDAQLLFSLTQYFLQREEFENFSCADELNEFNSKINENGEKQYMNTENKLRKTISMPSVSANFRKQSNHFPNFNRCYFTSVQVHVAQAFRSMDLDFDNKLSLKEFSTGINNLIKDNLIRPSRINEKRTVLKDTKSSYQMSRRSTKERTIDENVLRLLFLKMDLNHDGFIDYSKLNIIYFIIYRQN